MLLYLKYSVICITLFTLIILPYMDELYAAMDPRFEIDPGSISESKSESNLLPKKLKRHRRTNLATPSKGTIYTVKPGDHLFKILMRDYNLSNNEAELFIEEIKRENNIYDIKRLKIGQKITIPPVRRRKDGGLKIAQNTVSNSIPGQSFKLESPISEVSNHETVTKVQDVWNQIIPAKKEQLQPLAIKTPNFSLSLDPAKFPTFARLDGGRIVLDQNGSISPLVKSLIEGKDSSVRIISAPPTDAKHFMSTLLGAAGFYSVEENYSMEFGVDPKLSIQTDFKIEKTAESLIKQDVMLLNSGRISLPPTLGDFLKKEGFSLYEPFASVKPSVQGNARTINYISSKNQSEMIDSILSAFSVSTERDRSLDVFAAENNGISLSVKAERYFERDGKRYVVTTFDGDPINYTLFRILETKGYKVVILENKDDFRKVSEKIISSLKLKGTFTQHSLLQDKLAGYSLQMSGFKIDDNSLPSGGIFLTDRAMDRIVKDLIIENGFIIK